MTVALGRRPVASTSRAWGALLLGLRRAALMVASRRVTGSAACARACRFSIPGPHWFGAAGDRAAEVSSLLGKRGDRAHVHVAPPRENGDR
jgi:hypothetical protein